jgi:ABC-type amino acid transport substrate-binding protein
MKKILTAVLSFSMIACLAACGSSSSSSASSSTADTATVDETEAAGTGSFTTIEDGKLHMATNAAFPPYEMTTDDGGYEGIDVEIAQKICDKLGLELVVDDQDFSSVITSVQSGKSDIAMAGLTETDERKKNIDFTDTYATAVQSIIVTDDSDIQTADDLANASSIGCQEGTTGALYCTDDYGEDHVTTYQDGATAVQALISGKVDAVVIDNAPAQEYVENNDGIKILDSAYTEEEYAIGVSKDNPELRDAINQALKELQDDGTVQQIIDKYIKAD